MSDETIIQEPDIRTTFNDTRRAAELIQVGGSGVEISNFAQQVDFAKWLSQAGHAIPKHLRGNVGACLAVLDISQRWGFSPYQVSRLCYVVNDILAFQAQLVTAVINKFAPLEGRLRYRYEGEGDTRVCIASGVPKGETEPLEYRTPPLAQIQPKNSPLFKTDPDQQLAYIAGTRFCRRYFSEVLIGIYTPDELEDAGIAHVGPDQAKDITPDPGKSLHERLKATQRGDEGFRDGIVESGLQDSSQPSPTPQVAEETPAPSGHSVGAGNPIAGPRSNPPGDGDPKQAPEAGNGAQVVDISGGLPTGWRKMYAEVLATADAKKELRKIAKEFWSQWGGWEKAKFGKDQDAVNGIYDAFLNHFDDAEARMAALKQWEAL